MIARNIKDEIPTVVSTGNIKKLCVFLEISRHPDGLSIQNIMNIFGENKSTTWNQINSLLRYQLIYGRRMKNNGRKTKIFKATKTGINNVMKEMFSTGELLSIVYEEMINK